MFTLFASVPLTPLFEVEIQPPVAPFLSKTKFRIDQQQLDQDLSNMDEYLSVFNNRNTESLSYTENPLKTFSEVQHICSALVNEQSEIKRTFIKAAQIIFELFFPLHYKHNLTLKVRGSAKVAHLCNPLTLKNHLFCADYLNIVLGKH